MARAIINIGAMNSNGTKGSHKAFNLKPISLDLIMSYDPVVDVRKNGST
jgi:hypothetical protein